MGIAPELLVDIYNRQYNLQCYMKEKRGLTQPPSHDTDFITHEHVLAAIYFSSCINIEWLELLEVYEDYLEAEENSSPEKETLRITALEELIDVFHFLLSVFIFLGLKEDKVRNLVHLRIGGISSLSEYAGDMAMAVSSVISKAPYKTWKDQDNTRILDTSYQDFLFAKFMVCYNDVLDFALFCLNSDYQEFVRVYLNKNDLNFRRQEDKKLGYIQTIS